MDIYDAMQRRFSVRSFLDKDIEEKTLKRVIEHATCAPSWKNAQPYEIHIATGDKKIELSKLLYDKALARDKENPDEPYPKSWPTYIKKRMFHLGVNLFNHIGIARDDKQGRIDYMMQNYKFFNASAVLFLVVEKNMEFWPEFDCGILFGYISLALMNEGLGGCAQATLAAYPDVVKTALDIPEDKKLLLGMSIGYPDLSAKVNSFKSQRVPLDEILTIHS